MDKLIPSIAGAALAAWGFGEPSNGFALLMVFVNFGTLSLVECIAFRIAKRHGYIS